MDDLCKFILIVSSFKTLPLSLGDIWKTTFGDTFQKWCAWYQICVYFPSLYKPDNKTMTSNDMIYDQNYNSIHNSLIILMMP